VRTCRYPPCGQVFEPPKPNYWHCCWDHYVADKERKGQPLYDVGYRDGFSAGYRCGVAESRQEPGIPPELWRPLIALTHPDHWQSTGLACAANTCVRWLLEHRPDDPAGRN
jgi:hypothetical protein